MDAVVKSDEAINNAVVQEVPNYGIICTQNEIHQCGFSQLGVPMISSAIGRRHH